MDTKATGATPTTTVSRRPAHGPLASPQHLADRLNIFGAEQLRGFAAVVDGVQEGATVSGTYDYSQGLAQRAMARTAPARAHLNLTSLAIRERLLPGEQW